MPKYPTSCSYWLHAILICLVTVLCTCIFDFGILAEFYSQHMVTLRQLFTNTTSMVFLLDQNVSPCEEYPR